MVWSQYVYEATTGYDVAQSDDDIEDCEEDIHPSVDDWEIKHSDELRDLWRCIKILISDAFLEHELMTECSFSDFVEFCYDDHHDDCDFVSSQYESNLTYIWNKIQEFLRDMNRQGEFMRGATFNHWVRFAHDHSKMCSRRAGIYYVGGAKVK